MTHRSWSDLDAELKILAIEAVEHCNYKLLDKRWFPARPIWLCSGAHSAKFLLFQTHLSLCFFASPWIFSASAGAGLGCRSPPPRMTALGQTRKSVAATRMSEAGGEAEVIARKADISLKPRNA